MRLRFRLRLRLVAGQSEAMQLSSGANAPSAEALYCFRLPTATEACRAPLTGGPNSASLLPRTEFSRQILTAAAPSEVGCCPPFPQLAPPDCAMAGCCAGVEHPAARVQARHKCSAMPRVDCTAVRYQCTKQPDVSLCPEAFADGRFPTGTSARDFVRIEASTAQRVRKVAAWLSASGERSANVLTARLKRW